MSAFAKFAAAAAFYVAGSALADVERRAIILSTPKIARGGREQVGAMCDIIEANITELARHRKIGWETSYTYRNAVSKVRSSLPGWDATHEEVERALEALSAIEARLPR